MPEAWLPGAVSPALAAGLVLLSLVTSMMTAGLGAGGGILLLAVLSIALPPQAIIPVHGMIQLGANASRSLMAFRYIDWVTIRWFMPGLLVGALVGSAVLVQLPPAVFQLVIALFVLYLCWGPALPERSLGRGGILILSTVTTFLTLFVGATGPLLTAFLKRLYEQRFVTVATIAAATLLQHLVKVVVFGLAGFEFSQWLPLIGVMIAAGAVGTRLGLALLDRTSDSAFQRYLNLLLTLLALRLLWQAMKGLLG
ncbi:MAG: sulfite exporter TauE/SafE family protein [Spongiibacteraceae bacterium]|nr:sulfite exporter TauE/SafE family protein [Spongiibacteraceae bacterium]